MNAHGKIHQARAISIEDERRIVSRKSVALHDGLAHGQRLVDQPVHARGLRFEIAIRELCRIDGLTVRIEAIPQIERIE